MTYSDYDGSHQERNLRLKCTLRERQTRRIAFRMEVEPGVIITFLRFKGMKWRDIEHKLTLAFGEEVYTLASFRCWIHGLKTGQKP
jgi:hypothetical protein